MSKRHRKYNRHRPKQQADRARQMAQTGACVPDAVNDYEIVDQAEIDDLFKDFMKEKEPSNRRLKAGNSKHSKAAAAALEKFLSLRESE